MADNDEALFESALTDTAGSEAPPIPEAHEPEAPARDEQGRFAPKAKEPEAQVQSAPDPVTDQEKPKPEAQSETHGGIPSWRLKEEADARRAAEERLRQNEQDLAEMRRHFAHMQQNMQPEKVPDLYEDGSGFVNHHVQANIDPIKSEVASLREFYSRKDAIREYGEERVRAAYSALEQGIRGRDPEAVMIYQRAMQSMDPFGDIMSWHQKQAIYSQVGSDPNAWFDRQLEERMKDPAMQAKLIERIHGNVQPNKRPPLTNLPPSLNRQTAAAPMDAGGDDESDAGLLQSALRR